MKTVYDKAIQAVGDAPLETEKQAIDYPTLLANLANAQAGREKAKCLIELYRTMLQAHDNFVDVLTTNQAYEEYKDIMDSRTATELGHQANTNIYWCPDLSSEDLKKTLNPNLPFPGVTPATKEQANLTWMTELSAISTWATSHALSAAMTKALREPTKP